MKTLDEIEILRRKESHDSPSGSKLTVYAALSLSELREFLGGSDGLRIYTAENIPKSNAAKNVGIGSSHYHPKTREILYVSKGGIQWKLEDLNGRKRVLPLSEGDTVFYIPEMVLHQYECTIDGTDLVVIANTENYLAFYDKDFRKLQDIHQRSNQKIS